MWFQKYMIFCQFAWFCNFIFHGFVYAKAWVGNNVREASVDEFPFIAGIIRRNWSFKPERDTVCTAALITKQDVLTSEHCLHEDIWDSIEIIVGSIDLVSRSKYYIAWLISYDQWALLKNIENKFDTNDISILRLTQSVTNAICAELLFLPYREIKDKYVTGVGWGEVNSGLLPRILHTANLKIIRNSECIIRVNRLTTESVKIDKNILCSAGDPLTMLMRGDSGGPLLYMNKTVAINVGTCPFSEPNIHRDKVNVHVNLQFYENFISDITTT